MPNALRGPEGGCFASVGSDNGAGGILVDILHTLVDILHYTPTSTLSRDFPTIILLAPSWAPNSDHNHTMPNALRGPKCASFASVGSDIGLVASFKTSYTSTLTRKFKKIPYTSLHSDLSLNQKELKINLYVPSRPPLIPHPLAH